MLRICVEFPMGCFQDSKYDYSSNLIKVDEDKMMIMSSKPSSECMDVRGESSDEGKTAFHETIFIQMQINSRIV